VPQLKKVLSANAEATITVESLANDLDVSGKMTREEFEELAKPLASRIRKPLEKVGSHTINGCCLILGARFSSRQKACRRQTWSRAQRITRAISCIGQVGSAIAAPTAAVATAAAGFQY